MASSVMIIANTTLDWLAVAFDAPLARAVVFGVQIGGHLVVEVVLVAVILFLLFQKSYKPPKKPLTEKEIDELCEEWVPESLHPTITKEMECEPPVLERSRDPNLVASQELCTAALERYGVGSCGPRGFYGTIDVHLDCESKIANFLGTPDSILYSYGISTIFSAIPAFCKKGDLIIADEGVHWGVQNGLYLSRSTVVYFKHNNMESLESTLEKVTRKNQRAKKLRRYIVVEAVYQGTGIDQCTHVDSILDKGTEENKIVKSFLDIDSLAVEKTTKLNPFQVFLCLLLRCIFLAILYQRMQFDLAALIAVINSGQIAPLDEIIRLKEKYRFRVLLDESNSIGVLGHSGRGLSEYYGVPIEKIDIVTAVMGHALATDGGFCTGSIRVVDHQRLSSSGYVFSASLPPYLASAAITAIDLLEENPDLLVKLKENLTLLWKGLFHISRLIVWELLIACVSSKLQHNDSDIAGSFRYLNISQLFWRIYRCIIDFTQIIIISLSLLRTSIRIVDLGLSDIPGLSITSNPISPIVFLKLKKSTGSFKNDMRLLEDISDRVTKDSVLLATSKKSSLDKCNLPAGIRMFVSAGHSESDLLKACDALKKAAAAVLLD
ncbi:serine palmitoyltransferase component [Asimina triloba]